MKKTHKFIPSMLVPALLLLGFVSACNKSSDPEEEVIVVTPATVAVKNFNLKADSKVLANLDSVFFSIDLNKGVIFNADSLPKGTNVRKLIPVITFANTMTAAELVYSDSVGKETSVDYLENNNDSIDFTKEVKLNVTAADGVSKYSYRIKVNVHKELPDSMMWSKLAKSEFPSRLPSPLKQKTVERDGNVYTLIEESDNSYTLSLATKDSGFRYEKSAWTQLFTPVVESLTVTPDAFWLLDTAGMLYTSADMQTWTSTGEEWVTIIGPYMDSILGIRNTDKGLMHCHYPASDMIADTPVDNEFPVAGRSVLVSVSNKWTPQPTAFFIGGKTASGNNSGHTWAFDGSTWTTIDAVSLPDICGATLVRYTMFRSTGLVFHEKAYDAWFALGGRLDNGDFNRTLYYSYDNGVTWTPASSLMQFPDSFPNLYAADGVVLDNELKTDLSGIWKAVPGKSPGLRLRLAHEVEDDVVTWECPYIYFIGGTLPDGTLSDEIWRGVLARLAFTPEI